MQKVTTEYKKRAITKFLESFLEVPNTQSLRIDRSLASDVLECLKTETKEVLNEGVEERTVNRVISYPSYSVYHNRNDVKLRIMTKGSQVLSTIPIDTTNSSFNNSEVYPYSTAVINVSNYSTNIYMFSDKKLLSAEYGGTIKVYDFDDIIELYVDINKNVINTDVLKDKFRAKFKEFKNMYVLSHKRIPVQTSFNKEEHIVNIAAMHSANNFVTSGLWSELIK